MSDALPPRPWRSAHRPPNARQARALGFLAIAAWVALIRIALPVGVGLFLGVLLAFTLQPLYGRLRARRVRMAPAALLCTLGATTLASAGVVGVVGLFVTRGVALVGVLPTLVAPGGPLRELAERNQDKLARFHISPQVLSARLEQEAMSLGSGAAGLAAEVAGATLGGLLTLFFAALATYYVLRHWPEIVGYLESTLPLEPRHTHALLDQFRRVGRQSLRGTIVTGCVQGAFAALGYWVTGVPDPLFFGVLTAVASLVPAVGTMIVWIPVGIYLVASGHPTAGVIGLIFSLVVVVLVPDYVIRPKLVGDDTGVPAVLTFVSLFGGIEVFGVVGLVFGPVVVALAVAILRTYRAEVVAPRTD